MESFEARTVKNINKDYQIMEILGQIERQMSDNWFIFRKVKDSNQLKSAKYAALGTSTKIQPSFGGLRMS